MGRILFLLCSLSALMIAYFFGVKHLKPVKLPEIKDGYFGAGAKRADNTKIQPFTIDTPENVLQDLKSRLENTKFFDALEGSKWNYGINPAFLRTVLKYWKDSYDWKKHETVLNQFDQFTTQIEGMNIHFLRVSPPQGKYSIVRPLLLVHGWPGSVWEFYKIIPMLTDPNKHLEYDSQIAFEVIAPSIPGYGWSGKPRKQGFGAIGAGRVFAKLMQRLGHRKYYCQGGDWGSLITSLISQMYPNRVIGLHLNMPVVSPIGYPGLAIQQLVGTILPWLAVNPQDTHKVYPLGEKFMDLLQETGYMHIQATKPDTVGFALQDSPMGLAAYIIEKFSTWTNKLYRSFDDGGVLRHYTMDELLTNIMIYWVTDSIVSSQRFYKETFANPEYHVYDGAPIFVPSGFATAPNELVISPKNFLEYKFRNVTHYSDMLRGGHFLAFEEPKLLALDFFQFVSTVEV